MALSYHLATVGFCNDLTDPLVKPFPIFSILLGEFEPGFVILSVSNSRLPDSLDQLSRAIVMNFRHGLRAYLAQELGDNPPSQAFLKDALGRAMSGHLTLLAVSSRVTEDCEVDPGAVKELHQRAEEWHNAGWMEKAVLE